MDGDRAEPRLVSTGTRGGWKLPALAVAAVLVGLIALTRLGGAPPSPPAAPNELAAAPTLTTQPTPTVEPTRAPIAAGHLIGIMRRSPDGLTYADGIPTGISGEPVYRVRDVLLVPLGRTLLVGGWYQSRTCRSDGQQGSHCPAATMSDVALDTKQRDIATSFVALDGRLAGTGSHVVLATVEPDPGCSIRADSACQPRLRVLQQIWSDAVPG